MVYQIQTKLESRQAGKESDGIENKISRQTFWYNSKAETLSCEVKIEIQDCKISFRRSASKALVLKAQPLVMVFYQIFIHKNINEWWHIDFNVVLSCKDKITNQYCGAASQDDCVLEWSQ